MNLTSKTKNTKSFFISKNDVGFSSLIKRNFLCSIVSCTDENLTLIAKIMLFYAKIVIMILYLCIEYKLGGDNQSRCPYQVKILTNQDILM